MSLARDTFVVFRRQEPVPAQPRVDGDRPDPADPLPRASARCCGTCRTRRVPPRLLVAGLRSRAADPAGPVRIGFVGISVIADWHAGVLERMRVTPMSRAALLLGRVGRDVVTLVTQGVILVLVGVVFGLRAPVAGVLIGLAFVAVLAISLSSLSYAIGLRIKNEDAFAPLLNAIIIPMVLLAGIILPMSGAPAWLNVVSRFTPFRYFVDAVRDAFLGRYTAHDRVGRPGRGRPGGGVPVAGVARLRPRERLGARGRPPGGQAPGLHGGGERGPGPARRRRWPRSLPGNRPRPAPLPACACVQPGRDGLGPSAARPGAWPPRAAGSSPPRGRRVSPASRRRRGRDGPRAIFRLARADTYSAQQCRILLSAPGPGQRTRTHSAVSTDVISRHGIRCTRGSGSPRSAPRRPPRPAAAARACTSGRSPAARWPS